MRGSVDEDIESGLGEDASALDLEGVGSNTTHVRVLIAETVMMVLKLVSIIVLAMSLPQNATHKCNIWTRL